MEQNNDKTTNIIRLCAWILIVLGFYLFFSPIISLISWIPLIGTLLGYILGFAVFIVAFVLGSLIFFLVFALAWIRYRPLFGILLLTAVFAVTLGLVLLNLHNSSAVAPTLSISTTLPQNPILSANATTH